MYDDPELYLQGLINEIEMARAKARTKIYRMNAKISNRTVDYVKRYFVGLGYDVETKKCMSCKGTWDIIIFF